MSMDLAKSFDIDQKGMEHSLKDALWFYDDLNRTYAESILKQHKKEGIFLVRRSRICPRDFVLSLYSKKTFHHFHIKDIGGDYRYQVSAGKIVDGLDALIQRHREAEHGLPSRLLIACPGAKLPPPHSIIAGFTNTLHRAIKQGKKDLIKKIIDHPKRPNIDWKNSEGSTALHLASYLGNADVTRWLLQAGADVNGLDTDGYTALHRAVQKNNRDVVLVLMKDGHANPQIARRPNNNVALHEAATHGHIKTVEALLSCHVPVWPRNAHNMTPYELAVKHSKINCGKLFDKYTPPEEKTKREYWFHKDKNREDTLAVMQSISVPDGHFLVRTSSRGGAECPYVLSLCYNGTVNNHKIETHKGAVYFIGDGPLFKTLEYLVEHYTQYKDGLSCLLTHAVGSENVIRDIHSGNIVHPLVQLPDGEYDRLADPQEENIPVHARIKRTGQINKINREDIELGSELGQGEYGSVLLGIWRDSETNTKHKVAIKTLNEANMSNSQGFLQEAMIMVMFDHQYIVALMGVCEGPPLMLVQELVTNGSLQDFMLDYPDRIDARTDLPRWAAQIACGMNYLESKKFVHRDLATRNVLLQNKHLAKVGDFGLSRAVGENSDYYKATKGGRWPVKWYAPECMYYGTFSHASDVWSYGVTLWEMFTLGDQPYGEKTGSEVVQLIENNYRLPRPDLCPDNVYSQMRKCWEFSPENRPSFKALHTFFSNKGYSNVNVGRPGTSFKQNKLT